MTLTNDRRDVFISYSHLDEDWVREWLVPRLRERGVSVYIDYDGFPGGIPTLKNVVKAIKGSRKTLLILSPDYLESEWGKHEAELALTHRINTSKLHGVIPVLHKECGGGSIPLDIGLLTRVDFTRPEKEEFQLRSLIAAIRDEPLPRDDVDVPPSPEVTPPIVLPVEPPPEAPVTYHVIPFEKDLPAQEMPPGLSCPTGYLYLGKVDTISGELFYRKQDQHISVLFPAQSRVSAFLIDKYAITNQQLCLFLNDLLESGRASIYAPPGRSITRCLDKNGLLLAEDARDYWKRRELSGQAWGVYYQDGRWQPMINSAFLPVTLVSWQGAHMYGLWAHDLLNDLDNDARESCLPTSQHWRYVAQFDAVSGRVRAYPWGDEWQRSYVNYAGLWANKEVRTLTDRTQAYRRARPHPVADFEQGHSSVGCVQLIGNSWEWCSDTPVGLPGYHIIKGGACNSPQEHCKPTYDESLSDLNEYVGFRCLFRLP